MESDSSLFCDSKHSGWIASEGELNVAPTNRLGGWLRRWDHLICVVSCDLALLELSWVGCNSLRGTGTERLRLLRLGHDPSYDHDLHGRRK